MKQNKKYLSADWVNGERAGEREREREQGRERERERESQINSCCWHVLLISIMMMVVVLDIFCST